MRGNPLKVAFGVARRLSVLVLATALPLFAQESSAQQPAPPFKEEGFNIKTIYIGAQLMVDREFTTTHQNGPPSAEFRFIVPAGFDIRVLAGGKKSGASELVKLTVVSKDGKQAAEILRFVNFNISAGPAAARLGKAAEVLRANALPMITAGYENAKVLDLYATRIAGYDAVSMHVEMTKPGSGEVYLVKAAIILHPRANGVMAFLMADNNLSDIKTPDDLHTKGEGVRMIQSLRFIDHPEPVGRGPRQP